MDDQASSRRAQEDRQDRPSRLVIAAIVGGGVLALVLVGLVVFSLVGTGNGTGERTAETTAAEAAQTGFATPEEAYEAYKKAFLAKDWLAQIRACTPESQERMATGIGVAAMMSYKSEPKLIEILERHGVDASILGEEALEAKPGNTAQIAARAQKLQQQLAAAIRDKQAFYVEMKAAIEKVKEERQKDFSAQMRAEAAQLKADAEKAYAEARLVDLQIDGDSVQANQSITLHGITENLPIHFRRIDGRWYMHVPDPLSQSE